MTTRHPLLDGDALNATIATARLRVEPLAGRHAAVLHPGMQEPAIYTWISMPCPPAVDQLAARWACLAERAIESDKVFDLGWAVQRLEDGAWIGKLDAEIQPTGVASNVGYFFFPAYWGRGYASEAVGALSDHLARHGVSEQHATVTVGNEASCRVLEHAGFVRTRILPANDTLRGVPVDDVEYVRRGG